MLSNADPLRTFFGLVGEDAAAGPTSTASLRNYRCEGTSVKINLGVDRLPAVTGMPAGREPYLGGIMEFGGFVAEMDRAQHEARAGTARQRTRTSRSASPPSTIPRWLPTASTC